MLLDLKLEEEPVAKVPYEEQLKVASLAATLVREGATALAETVEVAVAVSRDRKLEKKSFFTVSSSSPIFSPRSLSLIHI